MTSHHGCIAKTICWLFLFVDKLRPKIRFGNCWVA